MSEKQNMLKMRFKIIVTSAILSGGFLLNACSTRGVPTSFPSVESLKSPMPDNVSINTMQPTQPPETEVLVATQPQATPSVQFPDAPLFDGYLFAPYHDPTCQLPCWQGLRVGISDRNSIQAAFGRETGLGNSYDFFGDFHLSDPRHIGILGNVAEDRVAGYEWSNDVIDGYFLSLIAIMDDKLHALEGLSLAVGSGTFSPQRVLKVLGEPSALYLWTQQTLSGVRVLSGYVYADQGILITTSTERPAPIQNNGTGPYLTYCLNDVHDGSSTYIVKPFANLESSGYSMIQQNWIQNNLPLGRARKVQDVSDVTPAELAERSLSEDNVCFKINLW
jgi:hypothetical protein